MFFCTFTYIYHHLSLKKSALHVGNYTISHEFLCFFFRDFYTPRKSGESAPETGETCLQEGTLRRQELHRWSLGCQ